MSSESRADAWAEKLAAQAGWLRLLVVHRTGPALRARIEPEDLVQEIYLRALARPAFVQASGASTPELRRALALLAREVVIDAARALRAAKRGGGAAGARLGTSGWSASALPAHVTGPQTAAMRSERAQGWVESFLRLAAEHRRVIGLRQLEGLSAAEVGRRMGRSEVAVHSLYRRALQAWAEELGGEPPL